MIYDTTRNITWLADMNYAQTSGHTGPGVISNGTMTWSAATAWANNLVYGGFSDWRLPTLNPTDASCTGGYGVGIGFNCSGGELSGRFVTDLGNQAVQTVLNQTGDTAEQVANLALCSNVQVYGYWSDPESALNPVLRGFFFTLNGGQGFDTLGTLYYAVAVRPGDVAASVPKPQTLALALLALGATVVARRRRSR